MTTKVPAAVSKWEIGGVPAAIVLEVLYEMETLPDAVKDDLPRYMLLAFIVVALVRGYLQKRSGNTTPPEPSAKVKIAEVAEKPDAA